MVGHFNLIHVYHFFYMKKLNFTSRTKMDQGDVLASPSSSGYITIELVGVFNFNMLLFVFQIFVR